MPDGLAAPHPRRTSRYTHSHQTTLASHYNQVMHYELWDIESRNLLYDFDTLDEALDAARELASLNVGRYPAKLALAQVGDDERTSWLGSGPTLVPLLDGPQEPPAPRAI